jgi:hypothetical protein
MHGDGWVYLFLGLLAWTDRRRIRQAARPTPVEIHRNRDL